MDQPSPDEDELELWSLLVESYEESHFPFAAPDPIEAIRFRLDQAGQQTADLLPYLQSKSKISEVMNGKRPLRPSVIRALRGGLKTPAAVWSNRQPRQLPEPAQRFSRQSPSAKAPRGRLTFPEVHT